MKGKRKVYDRFDKLCEDNYEEILNYVKRKIDYRNYHDAYDVTNKIFCILTENKSALKMDAPTIRSYIYSVATKCCLQYMQGIYRKEKHEVELDDSITSIPDKDAAQENADEVFEHVEEYISTLSPKEQELFRKYWIEKDNLDNIAKQQNVSYDSVRKANSRLKQKLTILLKRYFDFN